MSHSFPRRQAMPEPRAIGARVPDRCSTALQGCSVSEDAQPRRRVHCRAMHEQAYLSPLPPGVQFGVPGPDRNGCKEPR